MEFSTPLVPKPGKQHSIPVQLKKGPVGLHKGEKYIVFRKLPNNGPEAMITKKIPHFFKNILFNPSLPICGPCVRLMSSSVRRSLVSCCGLGGQGGAAKETQHGSELLTWRRWRGQLTVRNNENQRYRFRWDSISSIFDSELKA